MHTQVAGKTLFILAAGKMNAHEGLYLSQEQSPHTPLAMHRI